MIKQVLLVFLVTSYLTIDIYAQCEVTASANPADVVCGDCATLTAFGQGQGQSVFSDDFNSGAFSPGWGSTQQAMFNNPCSPNGVDGTTHVWMGSSSPVPRIIRTQGYDLTTATAGVTVCFDMLFAEQTGDPNDAPCEGPDEPDEGVALQYSVDGGNTWTTIHYFDPNGGHDPQFINWNNWCFQLPPGAITSNTQIRWFQDNDSGADYDHWGIDNVVIYFNDPTYQIIWQHDGYNYGMGSSGGANPTPVCPKTTTTYTVTMSNGTSTCTDQVTINVTNPTIEINAGNDTTICLGDCATLDATAKVIKRPAKTPTYRNGEVVPIPTAFGTSNSININITDLNMNTVLPGSITQVCIESLTFFGVNFFPPGQQTVGDLNIYLVCPDGTRILLIPSGVTTSTQTIQGYTNTCFTPVSTTDIATGSPPYTGNFMPDEPFNNLNGCNANGVWAIEVTPASGSLGFGVGFFYGWSITFDDPEISYTADIGWIPTSNLSNPNALDPVACPSSTTTYTLIASDTAGCVVETDDVTVTVDTNCCQLDFTAAVTQPACNSPNGAIDITVTAGSGNYGFAWGDGFTTEDRNSLYAGTYSVTITDIGQNCQRDTSFTLNASGALEIGAINVTPETCTGDNDGSAEVFVSGGMPPYNYIWSNGQNGPGITSVNGLAPGSYSVTVEDVNFCFDTVHFTIDPGPVCCNLEYNFSTTTPSCGGNDGAIDISVTVGSGNYNYTWGDGATSEDRTNLAAGNYSVTIEDIDQGCQRNTVISLSSTNAPVIDSITTVDETCAGDSNGTASVFASGGTGTLSYLWENGQTSTTINNLAPGSYTVTVSDSINCQAVGVANILAGPVCCALAWTEDSTDASCSASNGSITVNVDANSGTAPFEYSLNGGSFGSSNTFNNLAGGTYTVIIRDADLCVDTATITVNEPGNTLATSPVSTDVTCFGDSNGTATVTVSGGALPYTFNWSTGNSDSLQANLAAGTYYVTISDINNCDIVDSVLISSPAPVVVDLGPDLSLCDGQTGTIEVSNAFAQYNWSNGDSAQTIIVSQPGDYSVTVANSNGCTATDQVTVTFSTSSQVDIIPGDTTITNDVSIALTGLVPDPVNPSGFFWTPSDYLSCNGCQSPVASPQESITYFLTYTDNNGCPASDSVTITVEEGIYFVMLPNAFSPNGDSHNDVLQIFYEGVTNLEMKIFDRWGTKVFETTDPTDTWDGTYKGQLLDVGVYVYYIKADFENFSSKRIKGSVMLLR